MFVVLRGTTFIYLQREPVRRLVLIRLAMYCSFLKINADAVWFGSVNNVALGFGQVNDTSFLKGSKRFFSGFRFFKSKPRENKLSLRFLITKQEALSMVLY